MVEDSMSTKIPNYKILPIETSFLSNSLLTGYSF